MLKTAFSKVQFNQAIIGELMASETAMLPGPWEAKIECECGCKVGKDDIVSTCLLVVIESVLTA